MTMIEVKVLVDEARLAEFYAMVGRWLAGDVADEGGPPSPVLPWGTTDEDLALAQVIWGKLSDRAKAFFGYLMDRPGEKFTGEALAMELNIPNGKYGVAGVLAWPGRFCLAVGRKMPIEYEYGPNGESGDYWITEEVAALFAKARDNK